MNEQLEKIKQKDAAMYAALNDLISHLAGCYDDKYTVEGNPIDMLKFIYGPREVSKPYNIGNASKYISRYFTSGFSKSEQPIDLLKAIHYLMFEYVNKSSFSEKETTNSVSFTDSKESLDYENKTNKMFNTVVNGGCEDSKPYTSYEELVKNIREWDNLRKEYDSRVKSNGEVK